MSTNDRAAVLRREFDASFAEPVTSSVERLESVLAIRLGADPYALRLTEIVGLHVDRTIVPVPSPVSLLLGITGLRGRMMPVYDLAALLGYPPAAATRWLVIAGVEQPVALAFETFEAHEQVSGVFSGESSLNDDSSNSTDSAARRWVRGTVHAAGTRRPLIHVASVLETIRGLHT